jgi:hypothetical protein
MLLWAGVRQRWRSWLALSLLTALVIGLVLAGAATARRTATAFPRFEAAHGFDSFFYSVDPVPGVASLPSVVSAIDVRTPVAGAPDCACSHPINVNDFTVDEVPSGSLGQVVKLVAGNLPNQSDPFQVLASQNLEQDGVHIGSVLHVPLASAAQRSAIASDQNITPHGPSVALHVVGFEISEIEFPTTSNALSYDLYVTSEFDRMFDANAVVLHEYFFRLRHGSASLPQFEAQARAHGGLSASDLDALANSISTSIDPQAVGWWLLTGLVALIGLLALSQALARQAAIDADDYPTLSALAAPALHTDDVAHTRHRPRWRSRGGGAGRVVLLLHARRRGQARRPHPGVQLRCVASHPGRAGSRRGRVRTGPVAGGQMVSTPETAATARSTIPHAPLAPCPPRGPLPAH